MTYRPWGLLPWVVQHMPPRQWTLIGTLGVESRCLAAWRMMRNRGWLAGTTLIQVDDPPTGRFTTRVEKRLRTMRQEFIDNGGDSNQIRSHGLLAMEEEINRLATTLIASCSRDVIFDISSLPKRFFFPILFRLLETPAIETLLVVYSIPATYADTLAENAEAWSPLPMCNAPHNQPKDKLLIVGVGYQPLNLPGLMEEMKLSPREMKLLFPFPSPPPGYQKNWEFVRKIKEKVNLGLGDIERVGLYDMPHIYERLVALTNSGQLFSILAPYGPKPMSLAMCLYASAKRSMGQTVPVFYTQPTSYSDEYSRGTKVVDGEDEIYAYCLRISGRQLYSLS